MEQFVLKTIVMMSSLAIIHEHLQQNCRLSLKSINGVNIDSEMVETLTTNKALLVCQQPWLNEGATHVLYKPKTNF